MGNLDKECMRKLTGESMLRKKSCFKYVVQAFPFVCIHEKGTSIQLRIDWCFLYDDWELVKDTRMMRDSE